MPRKPKVLPGPSRLSFVLSHLKQNPRPALATLKTLRLTLAAKNDHFGARHFIKEELPRIRYANPDMNIYINRVVRTEKEAKEAEMLLEFKDGEKKTVDVTKMWSTAIFERLMNLAGGERWRLFKAERKAEGNEPKIPTTVEARAPTPKARKEVRKKRSPPLPSLPKGGAIAAHP